MFRSWVRKNKFWIFCIFLFLFLRLPSLFEPYWYGDEGIYLVLGQAIRKGLTLYTQIHDNKPPTLYYLAALAHTVFGFRLLLAFSMIGAVYFFNLLSKKLLTTRLSRLSTLLFLILTSIPLFEGTIANAEVFMLLPTLAGIYYFLYSDSKYKLIISGLLLGIAFTIKIPVAVEFGFLCFWLLISNKKNFKSLITDYSLLITGFVFPFALYLIYFSLKGAFSDFMFSAILQNFGYLSSWQTGSHSGSAASGGLIVRAVILFLFWAFTYFLFIKKIIDRKLTILFLWFSATIFGALLSTRPYPHYLIQVLSPFSFMIIYLFTNKITLKIRSLIVGLIFCLIFLCLKYKFYVYPVFSYYQNFYIHVFSLNSPKYRNYFGNQINNTYQISDYLKSTTQENEKIFIWGDEPYIYALSSRLPVGRFTVAYHIADFNQYLNVINQLKIEYPKTIIYVPQENRPFPELDQFLKNYYYPAKLFDKIIIYNHLD
jgi:hypothetical protein